jgi:hypothetical protein
MIAKNFNSFGNAFIKKLIAEIVLERGVDRSMRGERRGFLLDRGLLGHGRCGGRGVVPLDRLRLACHRAGEHLVHARDRNDLAATLDALADLHEVLGVLFGNEHCFDAPAQGREQLGWRPWRRSLGAALSAPARAAASPGSVSGGNLPEPLAGAPSLRVQPKQFGLGRPIEM